jgi:predicted metal-dependent hydrolase
LYQDKKLFNWSVLKNLFLFLFGKKGIYSSVLSKWFLYFRTDFHPTLLPIDEGIIRELHHRHLEDKLLV